MWHPYMSSLQQDKASHSHVSLPLHKLKATHDSQQVVATSQLLCTSGFQAQNISSVSMLMHFSSCGFFVQTILGFCYKCQFFNVKN